jgi:hypothetical protein
MDKFITLFIGIFVSVIVYFVANYIAHLDTKESDFDKENYFDLKHGLWFRARLDDGLSEKEAYEKIIVEQDKKFMAQYSLTIFFGIMILVVGAGVISF